jgi:hypothetical protein
MARINTNEEKRGFLEKMVGMAHPTKKRRRVDNLPYKKIQTFNIQR